ncbi:MAG: tRNA (adenosine(37)-N6)-dimethylallyltransferase MiaA [Candidatus Dasytiphilus stammeri]
MIKNQYNKVIQLPKAIFLMGPTASGKTELTMKLSKLVPVEVISVDSAMIYREMNIGTAKPSFQELYEVPHRLLNIRDPSETYSVAEFRKDALKEMVQITKQGRLPLLVGGSMLYFKKLIEGLSTLPASNSMIRQYIYKQAVKQGWTNIHQQLYQLDPIAAKRINCNDRQRILRAIEVCLISGDTLTALKRRKNEDDLEYDIIQFVIYPLCRYKLYHTIEQRFFEMINNGFENEVHKLFSRGDLNKNMPSLRCVGYRQMWSYIEGTINYDEMIKKSINATRHLAKHQLTWLRKWKNAYWIDNEDLNLACNKILKILEKIL